MTNPSVLLICHDRARAATLAKGLSEQNIQSVGIAQNLMEAYSTAEDTAPAFVLVDERFVGLPEFEMLLALFKAMDTRWLAIGQSDGPSHGGAVVSAAKSGLFPVSPESDILVISRKIREVTRAPQRAIAPERQMRGDPSIVSKQIVLIGSSTGGIDALSTLLTRFPVNCPPTVIVQHTGKSFGSGLVRLLDRLCAAHVIAAESGLELRPGRVVVAAGIEDHVVVTGGTRPCLEFQSGGPVSGHLPSIDVLFNSAANRPDRVGVLLTGMGRDGAEGLLSLRNSGAQTIGQDQHSSVVYGMPKAAFELGAVQKQLPLDQIAEHILECCSAQEPEIVRTSV